MADLVIKNGKVVTPCGIIEGGIAVKNGKILKVGSEANLPSAERTVDANGNFVIPGFIDVHTHIGIGAPIGPAFDKRWQSQFTTETEGAIHGGVTSLRTTLWAKESYLPLIDKYIAWGEQNSYIDFGIYPCLIAPAHIDELVPMAERGMPSWKCFYDPYEAEEGEQVFGRPAHTDAGKLYRAMAIYAEWGYPGLVMIHAENYALYTMLQAKLIKEGRKDLKAWSDSRPNICEAMMIESAAMIAEETGGSLYIVHMSTGEGVDICKKYQDKGVNVIAETLPCFLTHTKHVHDEFGVWGKINPPFREKSDIVRMFEGIRTGVVTNIGTDHCAYTRKEKEQEVGKYGDVWKVQPGLSGGMEHWLPIMFTECFNKGRLSVEQIVKVCCENNAKVFGLYPKKGAIQEGSDADLVIVDPDKEGKVDENFYHCINKDYSVYWGWKLKGMPVMTIVGGRIMVEDGQTIGKPGYGRFLPSRRY